jgi:mannose-6-phosphate isomerase-like protein (cupin superfamily)
MELVDLKAAEEFSPQHHVHKSLTATRTATSASRAGSRAAVADPSPPGADEIYHVIAGEGLFNDGRIERKLVAGDTVIFPRGEVHQVRR